MKIQLALLSAATLLLNGCYYSHPAKVGQTAPFNTTAAVAGLGGAAGGAAVGNAINKDLGAPVGAAAGAAIAGGATYIIQSRHQRELSEAYEEGQRKGRAQVFDEWWSENAVLNDPTEKTDKKGPRTRQIQLPAGDYESVPYHRRTYPYIAKP